MTPNEELIEDDDYDDKEETCPYCGAGSYDSGCPDCKPCGGIYSPGTEECDFCEFSDECYALYIEDLKRRS